MKNFRLKGIIKIFLLTALIFLLFFFLFVEDQIVISLLIFPIIIYQIYSLFKLVDTTNRELSQFLLGIIHSDFSQSFYRKSPDKSFNELHATFNEIIDKFQKIRIDKEEHYQYLLTVMQHVGIGLIAFKVNGDIDFINEFAKKLLKIKYLNKVKSLNKIENNFGDLLLNAKNGERKTVELNFDFDSVQMVVSAREFKLRGEWYKLISLQDIKGELEENEMEAWQKLIRVLTHEIMNSITPISSRAGTVTTRLEDSSEIGKEENDESLEDIKNAVSTIKRRSEGLINFVDKYRSLTKIPKPTIKPFKINLLFNRLSLLLDKKISESGITFSIKIIPDELIVKADVDLLEQVLLNLLINSIQATANSDVPTIDLTAFKDISGKINVQIKDNGKGISEEVQEKIFIPFFSTKQSGSGIGLSLSRQIIRAHKGSIKVSSKINRGTTFTIRL
ncbi:MAG: ATP-binding protein [Melioribacteraceae bacterium]|jgi:two-component system nitrogen regulation sensor histidine kinase NtrY|nr:ATP-binding protein [Melioribacteraceae bacterium]